MHKRWITVGSLVLLSACATVTPVPATGPGVAGKSPFPPSRGTAPVATELPAVPMVTTVPVNASLLLNIAVDQAGTPYAVDTSGVYQVADSGSTTMAPGQPNPRFSAYPGGQPMPDIGGYLLPDVAAFGPDNSLYTAGGKNMVYHFLPGAAPQSFDAPGAYALFDPGLAIDARGNIYYSVSNLEIARDQATADCYIARIAPDGTRTVFAGAPGTGGGFADGPAASARFNRPGTLAFDALGNLYVADVGNLAIRRITPDGVVSTVAGKGAPALPPSPMPGLPSPDLAPYYQGTLPIHGLAIARDGTLYYTSNDNRIHRISADGAESIYAGDGRNVCFQTNSCADVCPTPEPLPSCDTDGPAPQAEFNGPSTLGIAPDGTLYVLDGTASGVARRLRKITPNVPVGPAHAGPSRVTSWAPSPAIPAAPTPGPSPTFPVPSCDPSHGCPTLHGQVFDQAGRPVSEDFEVLLAPAGHPDQAAKVGTGSAGHYAVTLPAANLDHVDVIIRGSAHGTRVRPAGNRVGIEYNQPTGGSPDPGDANELDFGGPGSAADPDAPAFYLPAAGVQASYRAPRQVLPFETSQVTTLVRDRNQQRLSALGGFAVRADGSVVAASSQDNSIVTIDPRGAIAVLAGGPYTGESYLQDGQGAAAHFYEPADVALAPDGNAIVADTANSAIREVTPDGTVTTLAGHRPWGYADGTGKEALFFGASSVVCDHAGNVFVADGNNHCVRKITPGGVVTTFAGSVSPGYANGTGSAARFRSLGGIAIDASDVLYVSDVGNHRVRRITPDGTVSDVYGMPTNAPDGTALLPDVPAVNRLTVDGAGHLYLASEARVFKIASNGDATIEAGYGLWGDADGSASQAYFASIAAIRVAPDGRIYVTDPGNARVCVITPGS